MTTFDFQGHSFQIEQNAKTFLEKYLHRIDLYTRKHNINPDVVDDIYQSILDKLLAIKEPISQKKLIALVNELGEPEDVFESSENLGFEKETSQTKTRFTKIGSGLRKCVRQVGIRLRNIIKRTCLGIWRVLKRTCIWTRRLLKRIGIWGRKGLKRLGIFLYKFFTIYLRKFIWICLRISFIIVLFCVLVSLMVVLGAWIGDITWLNQSFKMLFDGNLGLPIGIFLACCCFWIIALFSSFSAKPIKNWYIHLGVLLFAITSGVMITAISCELLSMKEYSITRDIPVPEVDTDELIEFYPDYHDSRNSPYVSRVYEASTGIKAEITMRYFAKNTEHAQLIDQFFISPVIVSSGNQLEVSRPDGQMFSHIVPFNVLDDVWGILYLPANVSLRTSNWRCEDGLTFSEDKGHFGCW